MIDVTITSVGEVIRTLHGIAHYAPMMTLPTRGSFTRETPAGWRGACSKAMGNDGSPNHVLEGLRRPGLTVVSGLHV
jgi:hypothetical protein